MFREPMSQARQRSWLVTSSYGLLSGNLHLLPHCVRSVRFDARVADHRKIPTGWQVFFYGRGDRDQTCDLTVPNRARYQLRHTPIKK